MKFDLIILRVRLSGLPPIRLVESRRAAFWDRQRLPFLACMDSGDLHDLTNVVAGVAKGPFQCERHGMRLAPDHHGPTEVFGVEGLQRRE
jgi:hypothetical protein